MKESKRISTKPYAVLAVLTVLSFSLIGGVTSATPSHEKSSHTSSKSTQSKESQAATDLRVALKSLLQDHVSTNLQVNRSIAAGASQTEINTLIEAQVENSNALSGAVASIYGEPAGAQFSEMFLEHIDESNNFARAVAAGDESAKIAANEELNEYLAEITTFFTTAIPVLPYETVYGLLLEHESLINQSTEAFESQNFGQSKKIEQQALRQIAVIADALASGIIATQPNKF